MIIYRCHSISVFYNKDLSFIRFPQQYHVIRILPDMTVWMNLNREKSLYIGRYPLHKKNGCLYIIVLGWPEESLWVKSVRPEEGSGITMLEHGKKFDWEYVEGKGLKINIPDKLQNASKWPCEYAYAFRMKGSLSQ